MKCEMCMRKVEAAGRGRKLRRLLFQTIEREPIYEIMVCGKCADKLLKIIYRREAHNERMGASQDAEPEDVQIAHERGAVVLRE